MGMQRRWVKIAIGAAVVLVLLLVMVPQFVNADAFRPALESQLGTALGRKVTLGKLSFSLWSGSVVADQLAVADDPAFGAAPFLQAKSLKIGVDTGAFLFHHKVNVRSFLAQSPEIHLISNAQGGWNYATLGGNGAAATSSGHSAAMPNVTVGKMEIDDGKVVVSSTPAAGQPFVWSDVKVTAQNLSFTQAMPFTVAANLPGNGSVAMSGTAGPLNRQDASATPMTANLIVKDFNPVATGVLPASAGIAMDADVDAQVASDGKILTSTGKVVARQLQLVRGGSPAPSAVNLTYTVHDHLQARTGEVTDIAVETGAVAVHIQGTYDRSGPAVAMNLHVNAAQLPVDSVEELLPMVGVRLPAGSQLKGGTLTAMIVITGTATAPVLAGPVEVENTQLAGFDLASKIQGLKALTGTSGGTGIKTLKADVRETATETQLSDIVAEVPALGTATGNGTVTTEGGLNFQLQAKLGGSGVTGAVSEIAGGLLHTIGSGSVPITITGTTSSPVIRADVSAMVRNSLEMGKRGAGGLLRGLIPK
jgi:AsmA protein